MREDFVFVLCEPGRQRELLGVEICRAYVLHEVDRHILVALSHFQHLDVHFKWPDDCRPHEVRREVYGIGMWCPSLVLYCGVQNESKDVTCKPTNYSPRSSHTEGTIPPLGTLTTSKYP